jgi:SAM-dependent methyltransferase
MTSLPAEANWQDVECGAYTADMPLWVQLAADAGGPVLELGSGTGRVMLHLAGRGHDIAGIDHEPSFVAEANARLAAAGLPQRAVVADARDFDLGERFTLVLGTMQITQLLGGAAQRGRMLESVRRHLIAGGRAAFALVAADQVIGPPAAPATPAPVPDVRERDGWIYSSLPLSAREGGGVLVIERLRQTVSPDGDLTDELHIERLDAVPPRALEAEAEQAGLRTAERRRIPETDEFAGSEVVLVEAP